MAYEITTATKKIAALQKRIRAVQGGTSASKTVGIIQILIHLAQTDIKPTTTSIVSEYLPHLKLGAMKDFLSILKEHDYFKESRWFKSNPIHYTFPSGSIIEFFGGDQADKVRGPRRDRLFINEANNVKFETFEQLEVRTNEFVFLDWNPTNEFWYYTDVEGKRDDVERIVLNYKDNEALNPAIVASLEQRRNRTGWWRVYGEGQLGEVEGKIYKGWRILDDIPDTAHLRRYGLDYGYSNDPTAIVAIYYYNGAYILDEITYQKGLSNSEIAAILNSQEKALVIADSAEPKSNDELKDYGINIIGAFKGKDSVVHGIQYVQQQKLFITKRSVNLIKEYRNYLWMTDKNGKILNEPEHTFSHLMDASRYALSSFIVPEKTVQQSSPSWTSTRWKKNV